MTETDNSKKTAIIYSLGCTSFAILGVLVAAIVHPEGLSILGPIVLGPGITIFLFGAMYEFTLDPLIKITDKEFVTKLRYAYLLFGGLFIIMGIFIWLLG